MTARRKVDLELDPDLEDEEDEEEMLDPVVARERADPRSRFYDPRHARPISSPPQSQGWGEIDASMLEDTRGTVPAFPLDLLPDFWRDWVLAAARATCAP